MGGLLHPLEVKFGCPITRFACSPFENSLEGSAKGRMEKGEEATNSRIGIDSSVCNASIRSLGLSYVKGLHRGDSNPEKSTRRWDFNRLKMRQEDLV